MDPAAALEVARDIAREAGALIRPGAGRAVHVRTKSTLRDLVTEWDMRSEDLIRRRLAECTPDIPVLGEERGPSSRDHSDYWWLCDPIDGTVNFAHGLPLYAVTISLECRGQSVAGVVVVPAFDWEFYASVGAGAFNNDERLHVSTTDRLDQAMLATGFPYDRATNPNNNFREWEHFQRRAGACRRLGCASIDLCLLAQGWFDGYWETQLNAWDMSAGALIVTEAGGTVTSITGGPFVSRDGNALASNGAIHDELLQELQSVRKEALS